jgi:NAD(P)-dependent dehydrogenase (short-subunit alcohol dehydrogenase family)
MYDFKNKVALVTGVRSRRGLGHEIALRFAKEGANVAFSSRKHSPEDFPEEEKLVGWKGLDSVRDEIEAQGVRGLPIVADVSKQEQVQDMVDKTIAEFGRIDVVVANAGTALMNRDMLTMSADDWRTIIDINLTGAFLTAQAGARHMVERGGGGAIILIASTAAKVAEAHVGAYCPSKAGVITLGRVMAIELAEHNIRVNTVCPGHFTTNLLAGQPAFQLSRDKGITVAEAANEVLKDSYIKRILLKRIGYPFELANMVVFLASDEASFITGQDYNVDGGYTTS